MAANSSKIPVWLDCDPGHDDCFAILLCAWHPAIELLGVSTVHGNSSVEHTTQNAGSVLTAIGRPDVPVYQGADQAMRRPAVHAPAIHGEGGLDGTELLPRPATPAITSVPATDAIARALLASPPGTAWLIATGSLTNVGHLFVKYPHLVSHLKGLSIMGGAVGDNFTGAPLGRVGDTLRYGNWTPYAEFNIICDPEAAAIVFNDTALAVKTTLIPLDVSHQVLATPEVQQVLLKGTSGTGARPSKLRIMLTELMNFFTETYAKVFEITAGPPLHDPLAVAVILDGIADHEIPFYDYKEGEVGRRERYKVEIVTDGSREEAIKGETQTGRTIVKLLEPGEEGVKIPRSLDVARFWTILEECLARADEEMML